jgi:putative ABC transport system ATP-binding protein
MTRPAKSSTAVATTRIAGPIVAFREVSKEYRTDGQTVRALEKVSLDVHPGTFVAVVGPSGCGKSTLLNLAGAMDFPTSGEVRFGAVATASLDEAGLTRLRRENVGFIFQSFQLFHTLTVIENVELPLLLAGRANARKAAEDCLRWVGLDHLAKRYPHQLSGGQMQRTAIARALVHAPSLVLADEPTGNLDTATGRAIVNVLRRIVTERGATILMATHSEEVSASADVLVRMRDGRVEEVTQRPWGA